MSSKFSTTLLTIALASALLGPALWAQDEPKPDPLIPQQLDLIEEALRDRKGEQDAKAIGIMADLERVAEKGLHDDDIKLVAKTLSKVFTVPRPPDNPRIYNAAAGVLSHLGPVGASVLKTAYEDKRRFPNRDEWDGLRATLLREIGNTKDPRMLEFLLDEAVTHPRDRLMAAAGGALGEYDELPLRQRQDVVDRLVSRYGAIDAKSRELVNNKPGETQDFGPQNAQKTLRAVRGDWNRALGQLTGQSFNDAPDWRHWLNKEGKDPRNWKRKKRKGQ